MSAAFSPADLARLIGGRGVGARDVAADLVARHAEPHRRYHTAEHVEEVLAEAARLASTAPVDGDGDGDGGGPAVGLAVRFHDAVYDVRAEAGASEAASAELAVAQLVACGRSASDPLVVEVDRLIRLTAGHEVAPGDRSGALLVDADLWILSSPVGRYDRYATDVRAEYAHVPDDLWVVGRSGVLRRFLDDVDRLYGFGPGPDRVERRARARANLTRELASLEA
ncbi:HD domain-containing protein [Aquihabitans sp. McL0605]|uniref:HD domain-containing protein n=1 Tax=Aquihabitans sp. McL0605 TaxID=3415671 RepID=UPI003CF00695